MKYLVLLLVVSACASSPPAKSYINVMSEKNEVLARINPDTNEVKFFESPDKAVLQLINAISQLQTQLNKPVVAVPTHENGKSK